MKNSILFSIVILFSSLLLCSGQLIMGTPLAKEFEEMQQALDEVSDEELQEIEQEIEGTLLKSEGVLEDLYNKNKDENLSDEEMLSALKLSVKKIHDDQEEEQKKNISKDLKLATSIIGESTLDEIQEELKEGYFFHPQNKSTQSQKQKQKSIKNKKKEILDLIKKEKQWFQSSRNQQQGDDDSEFKQTEFQEKVAQNKKKYDSYISAQNNSFKKIEEQLKRLQNKNSFQETEQKDDKDSSFLQETLDSIFEDKPLEDLIEPIILDSEKERLIVTEEGEQLKSLKEEYVDHESLEVLEREIQDLMQVGDEIHEKFLDEQEMIEQILEKSEQQGAQSGVFDIDDDTQQQKNEDHLENQINENTKIQNQEIIQKAQEKEKEEEQEEKSRLYKEVAFAVIIILVIIFLIFGSQNDVFSYFSQSRRAKDPFYRDDEAQQSLIH